MIIYGYIPKSKKRKVSKAKQTQNQEWLDSINSISTNFSKNKSTKISNSFPSYKIPAGRETPHFASVDTGFIALTKPVPNSYTGNKMKGIATMHKSNAVPVFTDKEAKEISSMRRQSKMNPKGWSNEDWDDYEEYLQNLSANELEIELKLLHSLGKAKREGKNIVPNETFYKM